MTNVNKNSKSTNLALISAIAIIIFVQVPHVASILIAESHFTGLWRYFHAWGISISIDLAIVVFTLRKNTWTAFIAMLISTLFVLGYYFNDGFELSMNNVAISALSLFIPFMIKELIRSSVETETKPETIIETVVETKPETETETAPETNGISRPNPETKKVSNDIFGTKIEKLLRGGKSVDDIVRLTGISRATVYRYKKRVEN